MNESLLKSWTKENLLARNKPADGKTEQVIRIMNFRNLNYKHNQQEVLREFRYLINHLIGNKA